MKLKIGRIESSDTRDLFAVLERSQDGEWTASEKQLMQDSRERRI